MGKLTKEDILLLFLDDPKKLANELCFNHKNFPKSDEIRTLICELRNPECVCLYADYVDKSPRSDTRNVVCKDPKYAYFYAEYVDKSPHPDTRKASCRDPGWAHNYAINVDKFPHPDTRQAVQNDLHWKKEYEEWENQLKKT